jgi:mannose-1-phosphate guanylyltransferase/mannose-6-phosphate isomerase
VVKIKKDPAIPNMPHTAPHAPREKEMNDRPVVPIILAGGSGTRLWPLSRELYPKQLLPLVDHQTMLQNTALRLSGMKTIAAPIVICNEEHRFLVAEQLRAIGIKPASIILEPVGRNTAPAVAVAALSALSLHKDPVLLILPADHHIEKIELFQEAVQAGAHLSSHQFLVAFGIVPSAPETGYGYILKGDSISAECRGAEAMAIGRFVEKPDLETARRYVASGDYFWNSGIFMFLATRILEELTNLAPEIVTACKSAFDGKTTDLDFYRLNADAFAACPSDSIDYAVMEKTRRGAILPLYADWNDLGSWSALWDVKEKDENQNVRVGDVFTHDVTHCYLHATTRMIAAVGLRNLVVVETPDAVLVSPSEKVQDVKSLVQKLRTSKRDEALIHKKVFRPWGCYECLNMESRFQVKRITVKPGAKLSLQRHHHRAEHWVVVRGTALVTRGEEQFLLKEDESTYIPLGTDHRLENPGRIPLEIIEIQSGSYLGEDDIVRFDDVYGRKEQRSMIGGVEQP